MAIVRITSEEIRKKFPLTKERIKQLRKLSRKEPDMTDPDNPDVTELLANGLVRRVGRPKKVECKKLINLRLEMFALDALRKSGKGWQTRTSDYISQGVRNGMLLKQKIN
ncbi:MAG: BrnA antitoxin family protein [Candidatus Margulisbacteria bacterium]|jgi:uncharacterized protein (DUF4415 family)|nr:BrnA antitoxin family protein [Candidatus Margulisiibacteriota bacterium]